MFCVFIHWHFWQDDVNQSWLWKKVSRVLTECDDTVVSVASPSVQTHTVDTWDSEGNVTAWRVALVKWLLSGVTSHDEGICLKAYCHTGHNTINHILISPLLPPPRRLCFLSCVWLLVFGWIVNRTTQKWFEHWMIWTVDDFHETWLEDGLGPE